MAQSKLYDVYDVNKSLAMNTAMIEKVLRKAAILSWVGTATVYLYFLCFWRLEQKTVRCV